MAEQASFAFVRNDLKELLADDWKRLIHGTCTQVIRAAVTLVKEGIELSPSRLSFITHAGKTQIVQFIDDMQIKIKDNQFTPPGNFIRVSLGSFNWLSRAIQSCVSFQ